MNNYRYGMLTMAALVFLSISCYGKTNNRKDLELKGSVCAVVVKDIEFSIKFGEVVPTGKSNDTLFYFLKNGNVYMEEYASNNYRRFEYDGHNNLTEEMCVRVGMGKEYRIGDNTYHLNDTTEHLLYKNVYDSGDRLKEIKYFRKRFGDMEQYYRIVYSYDSSGKKVVYRYESSIDKEEIYNGSVRKTKDYHFGPNDPIIITETLNAKGKPTKREYIHKPYFENSTFSYNKYGDEVKILRQRGSVSHEVETTQYVYDPNGNWIKKLHYVNDKLESWTEREITYATSDEDYSKVIEEAKLIEVGGQTISDIVSTDIKHIQDSIQTLQKAWEEEKAKGGPIFTGMPDENAQFPGGDEACLKWLSEHIHMPAEAMESGVQGRVIVNYIIECDGSISCVRIVRGVSKAIDNEALRVVKSMPKWKPAKKNGQPVRIEFILPIMFRLN